MTRFFIHILLIIILSMPLSGCWLGAALGGAGGYFAGKKMKDEKAEKSLEKRIRYEERSELEKQKQVAMNQDEKLQAKIAVRLLGGGLTKIMTVQALVNEGVVTLYGNVPSPKIAHRAIEVARRMPGVKSVISNLTVIEYTITPTKQSSAPMVFKEPAQATRPAPGRIRPQIHTQPVPMVEQAPQYNQAPVEEAPARRLIPRQEFEDDVPDSAVRYIAPPPTASQAPREEVLPWKLKQGVRTPAIKRPVVDPVKDIPWKEEPPQGDAILKHSPDLWKATDSETPRKGEIVNPDAEEPVKNMTEKTESAVIQEPAAVENTDLEDISDEDSGLVKEENEFFDENKPEATVKEATKDIIKTTKKVAKEQPAKLVKETTKEVSPKNKVNDLSDQAEEMLSKAEKKFKKLTADEKSGK